MLKIKNIQVYGLKEAVISSRNAMRLEMAENTEEEFEASLDRAVKLVQASKNDKNVKCHDNYLTCISVHFDMVYTQYITKQIQRYHFLQYGSSSSLMHRITKMDFSKCCNKYVSKETRNKMQWLIAQYNYIVEKNIGEKDFALIDEETNDEVIVHAKTNEECRYYQYMRIISECPMGTELFVHVSTNYKTLQTMYFQRRNHKLKEDWGAFCKFIEELPYAKELIIGENN